MKGIRFIMRTSLFLALTAGFQMMRPLLSIPPLASNFIIGSMVNASLAVSSVMAGAWGGIIISIAAPVIAFLQQHIKFIWMIPIVAGGNIVFVLLYSWWYRKNKAVGVALSSGLKFLLLYLMVSMALRLFVVPEPAATALGTMFSWPQLVTAVIGGVLALTALKRLHNGSWHTVKWL